jgi:hypothetical protein
MVLYCPTIKKATPSDLYNIVIDRLIQYFGPSRSITLDRGSLFLSYIWRDFCVAVQLKWRLSTSFHPQTDSQTERQNQTLETYLRMYCNEQQDN